MAGGSGRYGIPEGSDIAYQPGSRGRVMRNKLGIASKREMDRIEYEALIRAQETRVVELGADTRFTCALLREMHGDWLGSIYSWAGSYRTVNATKAGFTWPPASLVAANMEAFERNALSEFTPCSPGDIPEIARRIAIVHGELLLVHPFVDGNGRLARWLAELMAYQAGLPRPSYRFAGAGSRVRFGLYVSAVREAYCLRYEALTDFFRDCLERGLESSGRG